ncbi:MAG TPA: hypothetical protein VF861_10930 [Telluria sp.]
MTSALNGEVLGAVMTFVVSICGSLKKLARTSGSRECSVLVRPQFYPTVTERCDIEYFPNTRNPKPGTDHGFARISGFFLPAAAATPLAAAEIPKDFALKLRFFDNTVVCPRFCGFIEGFPVLASVFR